MVTITVKGTRHALDVEEEMPLLWALRDEIGLTGTKFGCGSGQCGACTVHVDGREVRSCAVPIGSVAGAQVTTIEGLSPDSRHPVQQAWLAEDVPQCGYCQSGQIHGGFFLRHEESGSDPCRHPRPSTQYLPLPPLPAASPRPPSPRRPEADLALGT